MKVKGGGQDRTWCENRCRWDSYRLERSLLLPCRSESGVRGVLLLTPGTKTHNGTSLTHAERFSNGLYTGTAGRWVRVWASRLWVGINKEYGRVEWKRWLFVLMKQFYKTCSEDERRTNAHSHRSGCCNWVGGKWSELIDLKTQSKILFYLFF